MGERNFEEVLGALRSAAARDELGDLLATLLTRQEVAEMAERLAAVSAAIGGLAGEVAGERARVVVRRPRRSPLLRYPAMSRVAVLQDSAPVSGSDLGSGGDDRSGGE